MSGPSNLGPRVNLSLANPKVAFLIVGFAVLALMPFIALWVGNTYITTLVIKMIVYAMAAASLDLIMGYGGLVSFGHAAYLGIGSYAVAICSKYALDLDIGFLSSGFLHFFLAIVGSAIFALFVGAISLRTSGLYFIMITLAFTQMLYFLGVSLEPFGGDDGMNTDRSKFDFLFFDVGFADNVVFGKEETTRDNVLLYFFALGSLLIGLWLLRRIVNSRFGMVIRGAHSNENRMRAIGFPVYRYRLTAFVIAGVICGWAGAVFVNQTEFLTPDTMNWIQSGDLMIMVIMGGMGTIFGPVFGAVGFIGLEEIFERMFGQDYWRLAFGPLLVVLVLYARRGIFGMLPDTYDKMGAFLRRALFGLAGFIYLMWHLEVYEGTYTASGLGAIVILNALANLFPRLKLPAPPLVLMAAAYAIFCFILALAGLVEDPPHLLILFGLADEGEMGIARIFAYILPFADLALVYLYFRRTVTREAASNG